MYEKSQFVEMNRNNAIRRIKGMIGILLEKSNINNLITDIEISDLPEPLKLVVQRELENKELSFCSVTDFLIGKYKVLHMIENERNKDAYTIKLIIRLLIEVIGIKLFKTDIRHYITFDGKYINTQFLFDQISLNYKRQDTIHKYLECIRRTVLSILDKDGKNNVEVYPMVCDLADIDYWINEFNNMVIREVSDFTINENFMVGVDYFKYNVDFSKRKSINPVLLTADVYGMPMKLKEVVLYDMHFILVGTELETIVVNTELTKCVQSINMLLVGFMLQYYGLNNFGLEWSIEGKEEKVTRKEGNARSKSKIANIQNKWNFYVSENETLVKQNLLE